MKNRSTRSTLEKLESRMLFNGVIAESIIPHPPRKPKIAAASSVTGSGLTGEYFIGDNFQTPVVVRTDGRINFNYKSGRPDQDIPKGAFTTRWTGTIQPATTATYTFYTNANSGTRVIVNGATVIDNFTSRTSSTSQGTMSLTAGQSYSVQVEYVSRSKGTARMQLLWSTDSMKKQLVPKSALFPDTTVMLPTAPLLGTYFLGGDFQTQVMTRNDTKIRFNWDTGSPDPTIPRDTPFSIRWTGQITAPTSGKYVFHSITDDGVRLSVNGTQIISDWNVHSAQSDYGSITLTAGQSYPVVMEYFQNGAGHTSAKLLWKVPGKAGEPFVPFTLPISAPTAPTIASATGVSTAEIDVTWNDVTSETGFTVLRSVDGGATFTQLGATAQGVTSYHDTGLTTATSYVYEIVATNPGGSSPASAPATGTTLGLVPDAPQNLIATTASDTQINLQWDDVANETGFIVQTSLDGSTGWTQIGTTATGVTTFSAAGLNPGTQYFFRIIAVNGTVDSDPSNVANATTNAALPAYAGLTTLFGLTTAGKAYSIDTANGSSTQIGTLSFGTNAGGRDPITGDFYYVSIGASSLAVSAWHPANDTNRVITPSTPVSAAVALAAFRDDGTFFVATGVGDLYTIDRTTGASTLKGNVHVGGSTLPLSNGDMAFSPNGTLFMEFNSELYSATAATVNAATGSGSIITATDLGPTGTANLQIAFGENGILFGDDTTGQLYSVSMSSGHATAIGTATGTGMNDLANTPLFSNLSLTQTASSFVHGSNGTYTLTINNAGPNTTVGPITVVDTLPAGITFLSGSGNGWSFSQSGQTVTMTYTGTLASSASSSVITLNVAVGSTAASTVNNSVTVKGSVFDSDIANNTSTLNSPVTG